MEAVHRNPWAAIHVPLTDTSEWLIKEREAAVQDLERIVREAHAALAEVIGNMAESRDTTTSIQRSCGVSRAEALRRRKVALVCAAFPAALELLHAGKVSAEHLLELAPAAHLEAAEKLLDDAQGQCQEDFRDTVRQFKLRLENGNNVAKRQRAQRYVRFNDGPDGMVGLNGLLPPVDGATLKAALSAMVDAKWLAEHPQRAKVHGGHGGDSHEQRMADALVALASGGLLAVIPVNPERDVNAGQTAPSHTNDAATPQGNDSPTSYDDADVAHEYFAQNDDPHEAEEMGEAMDGPVESHEVASPMAPERIKLITPVKVKPSVVINFNVDKWEAEILGTGPVPVTPSLFDLARNDLYYAFKNMAGEVLKLGRARKDPTPLQRLAVIARDRHCIYPDCTITADLCDIHHLVEWLRDQGFTDVDILGLLCRPHHRHVHTNNLRATRQPDGSVAIHERDTGLLIAIATPTIAIAA